MTHLLVCHISETALHNVAVLVSIVRHISRTLQRNGESREPTHSSLLSLPTERVIPGL